MSVLSVPVSFAADQNTAANPSSSTTPPKEKKNTAQNPPQNDAGNEKPAAAADRVDEFPARFPDEIVLYGNNFVTKDGVGVVASFYPGTATKETPVALLLHGEKRSGQDLDPLMTELKNRGYAVLVPDFRGHGRSTKRLTVSKETQNAANQPGMPFPAGPGMPNAAAPPRPKIEDYLVDNFKRDDFLNMMQYDLLPFQRYLAIQHNAEKLNLNKLVIVGSDMGGTAGAIMAKKDWGSKNKRTKALVIVSPNYDPVVKKVVDGIKFFREDLPVMFITGKLNEKKLDAATKLKADIFGKDYKKTDEEQTFDTKVPLFEYPTEKQGCELIADTRAGVTKVICDYLDYKLSKLKESDTKWKKL
ncbi:MAG: alpha/beta hydrolase [Thermoguttaceae bacterium]